MSRSVDKTITLTVETTEIKTVVSQSIVSIHENKNSQTINVIVESYSEDGALLDSAFMKIAGDNYELIMSASPSFAPGKPENEYREIDLWHIIDKITGVN